MGKSEGSAANERDAGFAELYRRQATAMIRVAFLLLAPNGSADSAEEAVHDAFAKVYERWDRIDDHGAYLRTCVVNRCRDLQRRRRLERVRASDQTASYAELGARELLDALATLPHRQRAAVVLRYYEGLSEAEIARTLGIPAGTVKSTLSRALGQLREVVQR